MLRSLVFPVIRVFGAFWLRRRTGFYARFVDSGAYGPTIAVVALGGFLVVVGGTSDLTSLSPLLALVWFVVSFFSFLLVLVFLTSFGTTAVHSSDQATPPEELLARCRGLLEQQGFRVGQTKGGGLHCRRGTKALAETEWRNFSIEVIVDIKPAGDLNTLSVKCTVGVATSGLIRKLVEKTSQAVAELDAFALVALDKTLVLRQRAFMPGGLARTVFSALTISALVTALTLTGLMVVVGSRLLDYGKGDQLWWIAANRMTTLLDAMDLPLRLELDTYLETNGQEGSIRSPEEVLKDFKSPEKHSMVFGLKQADGSVLLLNPEEGSPLRPLAQALVTSGSYNTRLLKVGDRVFRAFDYSRLRRIESILGLQNLQLIGGSFLTYDDLALRAPRIGTNNSEFTFFHQGTSIARYSWANQEISVDEGSIPVPHEVMRASMEGLESEISLLDVLIRRNWADVLRTETRNEEDYSVVYLGRASSSGWSGISFAVPLSSGTGLDVFYDAAVMVGFSGFLFVLFLMTFIATILSGRIARPVLGVRDALRSIAEGDYSVRVEVNRTDEIGQLQELVNHTADELRKRESMKDLLGKYLSKQVADQILESDTEGTLAGTRKEVSVLFADVRGFTTFSERHDPEQVTKSLNEYFEVMVDVIASHEGVLDKYMGDGLMVVFGAPMAQPDHAKRAVITALEMQAALQSLNLKRVQRGDDPISIGIGVNTGLAISGNLGSIKRMEFTVIGDTVNLAARLETRAGEGQILIGRTTYEKVKDSIVGESIGQVTVKGKTEAVDVWLLTGLKPKPGTPS